MAYRSGLEGHYAIYNHKKLRYGYTTGTCAAAASKAAAEMLLSGEKEVREVRIDTPDGISLCLLPEDFSSGQDPQSAQCAVRKNGGDDVDATDGMLIYSRVSFSEKPGILIEGGKGIGRVTRPGLDQPPGNAAINSVPRKMIREEVDAVREKYGYEGGLAVEISAPEGERIAAKTFNGNLGIEGGISILGTSGIVKPMSQEGLLESMRVQMRSLYANGGDVLLVTPGNYGNDYARTFMDTPFKMQMGNFVGKTIDMAEEIGVKGLLFVAHIGKFIKVSGGIMNTHSREADCRAELMAAAALRCGGSAELCRKILDTATTDAALSILKGTDEALYEATLQEICRRIQVHLKRRAPENMQTGCILFSNEFGRLGVTDGVPALLEELRKQAVLER